MKEIKLIFLLLFSVAVYGQNNQSNKQSVNPNVKEVIVIFKTHFDIGYTHRVKELLQYYWLFIIGYKQSNNIVFSNEHASFRNCIFFLLNLAISLITQCACITYIPYFALVLYDKLVYKNN